MLTALDSVSSGLLYAFSNAVILRKIVLEMKLTKTMAKGTTMTRAFDSRYFWGNFWQMAPSSMKRRLNSSDTLLRSKFSESNWVKSASLQ
jgi:hypothetical protein